MAAPGDRPLEPKRPASVAVDLPITLGQFVKHAGLASTGGEAKRLVVDGMVRVNAAIETRRGHKLAIGDVVEAHGVAAEVAARPAGPGPGAPGRTGGGRR